MAEKERTNPAEFASSGRSSSTTIMAVPSRDRDSGFRFQPCARSPSRNMTDARRLAAEKPVSQL